MRSRSPSSSPGGRRRASESGATAWARPGGARLPRDGRPSPAARHGSSRAPWPRWRSAATTDESGGGDRVFGARRPSSRHRHPCTLGCLAISGHAILHDRHAVLALFGTGDLSYLGCRNGSFRFALSDFLPIRRPFASGGGDHGSPDVVPRSAPGADRDRRRASPPPRPVHRGRTPSRFVPTFRAPAGSSHRRAFRFRETAASQTATAPSRGRRRATGPAGAAHSVGST